MSRIICPLYLGQAENMEWLVMDAEILSFMKQFHLWYCKNSFLIYLSCEYGILQMLPGRTHAG